MARQRWITLVAWLYLASPAYPPARTAAYIYRLVTPGRYVKVSSTNRPLVNASARRRSKWMHAIRTIPSTCTYERICSRRDLDRHHRLLHRTQRSSAPQNATHYSGRGMASFVQCGVGAAGVVSVHAARRCHLAGVIHRPNRIPSLTMRWKALCVIVIGMRDILGMYPMH